MLAACEYLIAHRDTLTQRVFINLPGGLRSNNDSRWDAVKAGSTERCGCGNERVIKPANPRGTFEARDGATGLITKETPVYFKPVGGDKSSTLMKMEVVEAKGSFALTFLSDPFAPLILSADMFSRRGYELAQLRAAIAKQPGVPAVMMGGDKTPIAGLSEVDPVKGTVSYVCDKDVEAYTDPNSLSDAHSCP